MMQWAESDSAGGCEKRPCHYVLFCSLDVIVFPSYAFYLSDLGVYERSLVMGRAHTATPRVGVRIALRKSRDRYS